MAQFLDLEAEELARSYINFAFSAGPPRWPTTRFVGATERLDIGCIGGADTETYAYCPPDETVYIGHDALWLLYDEAGDAAAVAGYVHELGHHLQRVAGVPPQSGENALTIQRENQADCVAGAFIGWADQNGILNQDDDIGDLVVLVRAIAGLEEDPNRDHGTIQERANSMDQVIASGMFGCNTFFPDAPLIISSQ